MYEFTFRYNNGGKLDVEDQRRARVAAHAMQAKRLTYRRISGGEEGATAASAG